MCRKIKYKRMIAVIGITVTALLLTLGVSAGGQASGTCGENLTWELSNDWTLTVSGDGAMDDFNIDEAPWSDYKEFILHVVIGDAVTNIGNNAFYGHKGLQDVVLGRSVTDIGNRAFCSCDSLYALTVGDATTGVGTDAFYKVPLHTMYVRDTTDEIGAFLLGHNSLTEFAADDTDGVGYYDVDGILYHYNAEDDIRTFVKIPEGMLLEGTYTVEEGTDVIGASAASEMDLLEAVVLPASLDYIDSYAFKNCDALRTVTFAENVDVHEDAFYLTDLEVVYAQNGVTSLSIYVVNHGTLTTFDVDDTDGVGYYDVDGILYRYDPEEGIRTLVKIPESMLLEGTYTVAEGTDVVGASAARNVDMLEAVVLPVSLDYIDSYAFKNCDALRTVTFTGNVGIHEEAFSQTDLTTIYLHNAVTDLNAGVYGKSTLTAFVVEDTDGVGYYDVDGVLYHYDGETGIKTLVKVPEDKFLEGTFTVEAGTDIIGSSAFGNMELMNAVVLPESVTEIQTYAFRKCDALTGIYFYGAPPAVVGTDAFPAVSTGLILYYIAGTDGWTNPWRGYPTEVFQRTEESAGDINGDNKVDETDGSIFSRFFAGWAKRYREYFTYIRNNNTLDINGDGKFDRRDVMILVRYLAGWKDYEQYFQ